MTAPTPYEIEYNFAGFQASNPDTPLPAPALDNELENIERAISETQQALVDLGEPEPVATPTKWTTSTDYEIGDIVFHGALLYTCLIEHTSNDFSTDLAVARWEEIADFTPGDIIDADDVTYDNSDSGLAADHVAPAIDELVARIAALEAVEPPTSSVPVGAITAYAGDTAPDGWLLCDGTAYLRAAYADLFVVIGDTYGVGDGSTTFNVPDTQGRVLAGLDTDAGRLTNLTGGIDGGDLANVGGGETHTLTSAQLAAHAHTGSASTAAAHGHPVRMQNADDDGEAQGGAGGIRVSDAASDVEAAYTGTAGTVHGHQIGGGGAHTHTITVASAGSGAAHNNVQPTIIVNYIIYSGVTA